MGAWRRMVVGALLLVHLFVVSGCAAHQRRPTAIQDPASMDRPATEGESWSDEAGQVAIVVLIVVVTVSGILIPLLLRR